MFSQVAHLHNPATSLQMELNGPVELPAEASQEEGELRGRLVVLYGSQTGTAEDLAERIGREARR